MKSNKTKKHSNYVSLLKGILIISIITLSLSSCEKYRLTRVGFDGNFEEPSKGLTILDVSRNATTLFLDGFVEVETGTVDVELLDPDGSLRFEKTIHADSTHQIFEQFQAKKGYWKLRYKSNDATGYIRLHMDY